MQSKLQRLLPAGNQHGGTLLGVILGLVVGLAVAIVVALYINHAPTPFKVQKPNELPAAASSAPIGQDPNRALQSRVPVVPYASGANAGQEPDNENVTPGTPPNAASTPAANATASAASAKKEAKTTPKPTGDPIGDIARQNGAAGASAGNEAKSGYLLQVGSYKNHDDAESQKANLAMLGVQTKITEHVVNGVTLYRVRTAPFRKQEDLDQVREKIQSAGNSVSVIPLSSNKP